MPRSLLERALRKIKRRDLMKRLTPVERQTLLYTWEAHARPEQLEPDGDWRIWIYVAGRGAGKTKSAAELVRSLVESGHAAKIALVAKTPADARDVMVEQGVSSIMEISRPGFRPMYEPSKRRLTWPNGAIAITYSAEAPEQLRGPQHDFAWVDELAKFDHPRAVWDNLMLGLRVPGPDGTPPRCIVTTTPRPTELIIELVKGDKQPDGTWVPRPDVAVTHSKTWDNAVNLAPGFLEELKRRYAGTRLGRQEIDAEILEDVEGALWNLKMIDASRVSASPDLSQIVVGVDPAITAHEGSDETGIVVAGRAENGELYVLADRSCRESPAGWAGQAIGAYNAHEADCIIAESNQGGDMVKHTIHSVDSSVPVRLVHASRGKRTRAEPIAALYEQGRVHHVGGLPDLEDQLTSWCPGEKSPDRLDAAVYACSALCRRVEPGRVGIRVIG